MKMPTVGLYVFTLREATEALIKAADLHEGKWVISLNFNFSAGIVGNPDNLMLGATVGVSGIQLQRSWAGAPPSLIVDASEVNPLVEAAADNSQKG